MTSDAGLIKLLNKAVILHYGGKCIFCGAGVNLDVHHIVPRGCKLLRHDWRNAVPVCRVKWESGESCHGLAETSRGKEIIKSVIGETWHYKLFQKSYLNFKDYLLGHGMTENEFNEKRKQELLAKIGEREGLDCA